MKKSIKIPLLICALLGTITQPIVAGTPAQEKAFTDKYKTAFEAKDTATLESFLYTQGADPEILGFYKMMQSGDAGGKISKIELVELTGLREGWMKATRNTAARYISATRRRTAVIRLLDSRPPSIATEYRMQEKRTARDRHRSAAEALQPPVLPCQLHLRLQ